MQKIQLIKNVFRPIRQKSQKEKETSLIFSSLLVDNSDSYGINQVLPAYPLETQ